MTRMRNDDGCDVGPSGDEAILTAPVRAVAIAVDDRNRRLRQQRERFDQDRIDVIVEARTEDRSGSGYRECEKRLERQVRT